MEFRGQFDYLSNFYPTRIEIDGIVYESAEAAFQAHKCIREEDRRQFADLSAVKARHRGRQIKCRSDWEKEEYEKVQRSVIRYSKSEEAMNAPERLQYPLNEIKSKEMLNYFKIPPLHFVLTESADLDTLPIAMNVVERMAELAMIAHNGVNRDGPGNVPYIVHPHAVVCMLKSWGYTEAEDTVTLAVAWGHDVLEDTDMPESRIRDACGELAERILDGLHLLTFKPSVPSGHPGYGSLKAAYIEHIAQTASVEILPVKIADRLCNTLEFKHDGDAEHARAYLGYGEPLFKRIDELKFPDAIRREIEIVKGLI